MTQGIGGPVPVSTCTKDVNSLAMPNSPQYSLARIVGQLRRVLSRLESAMAQVVYLYKISAAIDWLSTLFMQGTRAQWVIYNDGTVNGTEFAITKTVSGQIPDPTITLDWNPNYGGGLPVPPGAKAISDSYDLGVLLPIPDAYHTVSYGFNQVQARSPVTVTLPNAGNNWTLALAYNDPAAGAGGYIIEVTATVTDTAPLRDRMR
jgi:hypothetical protein